MRRNNPDTLHPPLGVYSHSVSVPAGAGMVFLSGQVGIDGAGAIARGAREQARQALDNIRNCLAAEGMTMENIVRLNVFLVDEQDMAAVREERLQVFGSATAPASTLLIVKALAHPDLSVEMEAVAAK